MTLAMWTLFLITTVAAKDIFNSAANSSEFRGESCQQTAKGTAFVQMKKNVEKVGPLRSVVYLNQHGVEKLILQSDDSSSCDRTVWWLHVPKTGTSFLNSARRCRWSPSRGQGNHEKLPPDASDELLSTVVTILRHPDDRLISAYTWIKKEPGCCTWDWGWEDNVFTPIKKQISQGEPPSATIGRFQGCMTNMITGRRGCMSGYHPTDADLIEAERRINKFYFVGLISEWKLSICLYNYKVEGRRYVSQSQLVNTRPTNGKNLTVYDTSAIPHDVADQKVYEAAKSRFLKEVGEYGVSQETCPEEP